MPAAKRKNKSASQKNNSKKAKKESLNPFEVRVNRKKHDVLGQKSKSDVGLPGVARSKSIQKRKKTLLVEYKQRNKSNRLVDRRFGEGSGELSVEEKMMRRFILEKKRKHERSSTFNLNDNEEDELTHFGRSIGSMDKFDDVIINDEDDIEERMEETHFGGFLKKKRSLETEETPPKSRKQIMDEIVAKSKVMKFERQSEQMEVQDLMETVDSEWKSIQNLLSKREDNNQSRSVDDYDRSVRELQFERRGQALDRMKTDEELALEEKGRLEKLEANRIRRMKGYTSDDNGGDMITSADFMKDSIASKKKKDVRFTLHYEDGKMVLPSEEVDNDPPSEEDGGGGGDSDDDDGDGSESDDDSDGSGLDDECDSDQINNEYASDLDSEDPEDEENEMVAREANRKKNNSRGPSEELPYTFTVPQSLKEFCSVVQQRSPEECVVAVERIHSCNHPSISPTNKLQLQEFLVILLEYCMDVGGNPTPENLATVNQLVCPLLKLARLNAQHSSVVFCNALSHKYKTWRRKREFPPLSAFILFQLVGKVFPPSDYCHPVTTPAAMFMGQILSNSQVNSMSDLVRGLLICSSLMEYISDSKRFIPELVNFLTSAVGCFSKSNKCVFLPPCTGKSKLRRELTGSVEAVNSEPSSDTALLELMSECDIEGDCLTTRTKCHALKVILDMSSRLSKLYKDCSSFTEIFKMLQSNLKRVAMMEWPLLIEKSIQNTRTSYAELASRPKVILQLLKQKPKSIKFYEPKFDAVYEFSRKKSRSKGAGEEEKLKYKLKKETKGAIREIRKDSAFLAKVKLDEVLVMDAERRKKTRQLMNELQTQQHEEKVEKLHAKRR